ncbi:hypothetical protein A8924_3329 [Saccharopolyspora erythraea NRRL 2338]|uniref:Uncharacterized protein n=3 Tax=Saccharopolyspora erythraea TaxID=1836 RepID=A4FDT9_SACEN|nr:hypothetical protein A8924_3329 [Saccharopolyspora erythraea NRRL 2338]CAM02214.1 hypothetical protein SACE_2936 [Saccharopolyspora erythraea NRRL 2338]
MRTMGGRVMGEQERDRRDYERGLPGYHDPMHRVMGAPAALSALTLRLWLAGFGAVFCTVAAVLLWVYLPPLGWMAWVLLVLAVIAVVDFAWVAHRKRRGEPG